MRYVRMRGETEEVAGMSDVPALESIEGLLPCSREVVRWNGEFEGIAGTDCM